MLRVNAYAPAGKGMLGAKLFGWGSKPGVNYAILLFDRETGLVRAIVDGMSVTKLRTAATSAVAARLLAPAKALKLGVIGSGLEARSHVEALASVLQIAGLSVFSPNSDRRARFAADFVAQGIDVCAAANGPEALADADIVIAAAKSNDGGPVIDGAWVPPYALVISIGSTMPGQREVDTRSIVDRDLIVCDTVENVLHTGDLEAALAQDATIVERMISLSDLVSGAADERLRDARSPMFKSTGSGLQDVVVAEAAYRMAVAASLATDLPINFAARG
ncbi:ornithine cyclodeaminase family protein [Rhizorhabdus argentea]|uniref:ornithine cyclodeaminase family protein n=1 Tax=Rhizorhabdus argentea TaxID=1387174 RepID=UPI0030EC4642